MIFDDQIILIHLLKKLDLGLCYGYSYGYTVDGPLMLTNDFLNEMASKLAKFHNINYKVQNVDSKTHYERMVRDQLIN